MYLKHYFPAEYYAAVLTNTDNSESVQDKIKVNLFQRFIIKIKQISQVRVLKPDINESKAEAFQIKNEKYLICPLSKIKDVGIKAAIEIEQHQPYTSFSDLLKKVKLRIVNKRVLRALIYSCALKFDDTISIFEKKYDEKIDKKNFIIKQFEYLSFVSRKDIKKIEETEYSLRKAKNFTPKEYQEFGKKKPITVCAFINNFRKKMWANGGVTTFVNLYDGSDCIEDCTLNDDSSELKNVEEGMLITANVYKKEKEYEKNGDKYTRIFYTLYNAKEITPTKEFELTHLSIPAEIQEENKEIQEDKQITVEEDDDLVAFKNEENITQVNDIIKDTSVENTEKLEVKENKIQEENVVEKVKQKKEKLVIMSKIVLNCKTTQIININIKQDIALMLKSNLTTIKLE
jgi:hypothetical protein